MVMPVIGGAGPWDKARYTFNVDGGSGRTAAFVCSRQLPISSSAWTERSSLVSASHQFPAIIEHYTTVSSDQAISTGQKAFDECG